MKYLIAGGAGFIGHHLVKRLAEDKDNKIMVVDNLSTGSKDNYVKSEHKNVEYRVEDICNNFDTKEPFDRIVNLACPASPVAYQMAPLHTMLSNVQGTYNLLGLAFMKKARFLQASTSEVYGDPLEHPQKEEYWGHVNCYGPRSCYDEGKRAAETLVYDFQRMGPVDCRIIRIFNTYGPNMAENDGRVVSNFITQALKGDDITIYGDGSQTRSFCYVSDTVEALIRALEGRYDAPLNVGNPVENTVLELAGAVIKATKSKSNIVTKPLPINDPRQRCPNIDKMKKLYHWEPIVPLKEGLAKTVAYFRALQLKK